MMSVDSRPARAPSTGQFWSPPIPVDDVELSPTLLRQINFCDDRREFRAYVVQVFADLAGPPEAVFELAFNRRSKRACAILEAVGATDLGGSGDRVVAATDPIWVVANSPRSAIDAAFQALVDRCSD
ncbi:hypothetical protein [Ensifer adhaerens]|uniref:hypothetical protein n=1 Tax=Ensifer adhaerens TaxID=106592 RepID=UPI00098FE5DA|nr:hypothetical protein [Ensifer adhaerens]